MDASAIRFENWLPQISNSGVQWWPSPPVPKGEPASKEPRQPAPAPATVDPGSERALPILDDASPDPGQQPPAACSAVSP